MKYSVVCLAVSRLLYRLAVACLGKYRVDTEIVREVIDPLIEKNPLHREFIDNFWLQIKGLGNV